MKISRKNLKKLIFENIINENYSIDTFPVAGDYNLGYDKRGLGSGVRPKVFGANALHNSDYRPYPVVRNGKQKGPHWGVDIFAKRGTPVVSPVTGTVTKLSRKNNSGEFIPSGDGGLTVTVSRGGTSFYHAHLDTIKKNLSKGDQVSAGEQIGTVGNTGNAKKTYPHLHFTIHGSSGYKDPFEYLEPHIDSEGEVYNSEHHYTAAVNVDPIRWGRDNVEELESILDGYLDLGEPDKKWIGGEASGTTDEAWRHLINLIIKDVYPKLDDSKIEIIKYDWEDGAGYVNLKGDPAGALEFIKILDKAAKLKESDDIDSEAINA